jgi:diguanylate cyclase (GGDEF)-like protein
MELFKPKECLILIVDDVMNNIRLLDKMFEGIGYKTVFANSGKQALEIIENQTTPIDLILLDLMMPEMDGIEVCTILKANPMYQDIPIIFITADDRTESFVTAFKTGAIDYIKKPFQKTELLLRVENQLKLNKAYAGLRKSNDELLEAYALLEQLVTIDPLTGLGNRRSLLEFGDRQLKLTQRYHFLFSIMMIDLDDFKKINAIYGYPLGDEVLKNIAKILKNSLRNVDYLGRFGGDEFMIILPNTNLEKTVIVAERVREKIANFVHNIEQHIIQTTVSIGIASYNSLDDDVNQIIKRADQALYKAKSSGRNCSIAILSDSW